MWKESADLSRRPSWHWIMWRIRLSLSGKRWKCAANLIALLRCHEISESDYRKISAKIRTAESLTDLEFTSYERTYQVQHMALSGVELIGYMADPFADIKGCEKHLEGMFMRNQLSEVHIRIFKELPKYLNRLD